MPHAPVTTPEPAAAETAPEPAPGPDICIIVNAGSGAKRGRERRAALDEAIAHHPGRFTIRQQAKGSDIVPAAERALADGFDTVVAAGGDGTVAAVASVLAGSGRKFGVLPMGTFNFYARALGLPLEPGEAADVIVTGGVRDCDAGEVNGVLFLNNASLGAYAQILQRREGVYRRWGRSRLMAYWSVVTTLARIRRPLTLKVTVDGAVRRLRTPLVFVAANAHQLETFGLAGADCIRDGGFALFIAPDCRRWALIRYAARLAFGTMKPDRDFELLCGREIVVETRQKRRLLAHDGERQRMTGPFRFRRRPGALRVLVPQADG